jgi:hypothetical protein
VPEAHFCSRFETEVQCQKRALPRAFLECKQHNPCATYLCVPCSTRLRSKA